MDSLRCRRAGEPGVESAALALSPAAPLLAPAALLACVQPEKAHITFSPWLAFWRSGKKTAGQSQLLEGLCSKSAADDLKHIPPCTCLEPSLATQLQLHL